MYSFYFLISITPVLKKDIISSKLVMEVGENPTLPSQRYFFD